VRERFSARQKDIEKLIARIPNRVPLQTQPAVGGPAYPEGRTIMARAPSAPVPDDSGARTVVGASPLADRRPTELGGRELDAATDPGRPAVQLAPRPTTPPPQPPTSPSSSAGLSAEQLFADDDDGPVPTRIIPGGPLRPQQSVQGQPTDPRRNAVHATEEDHSRQNTSGGSSKTVVLVAAILALLIGGVGGAFIIKGMQPTPTNAVVRLVLSSDRPATVFLGQQELGPTPISVFVPSGHHLLELREVDGPKRSLDVNLPGTNAEERMVVTLDSLPRLP